MLKLYYSPKTRSTRPRWMLEEIGEAYELVRVDLSKGEHKQPAHLAVHPYGAVPALADGAVTIFESAAICAHLAERFPDAGLAPRVGTAERALYTQWIFHAAVTAEAPVLDVFLHTRMYAEEKRIPAVADAGTKRFQDVAKVLDAALGEREFLVGEDFTTADLLTASILSWAKNIGLLDDWPRLIAYSERLTARPAYERATAD